VSKRRKRSSVEGVTEVAELQRKSLEQQVKKTPLKTERQSAEESHERVIYTAALARPIQVRSIFEPETPIYETITARLVKYSHDRVLKEDVYVFEVKAKEEVFGRLAEYLRRQHRGGLWRFIANSVLNAVTQLWYSSYR